MKEIKEIFKNEKILIYELKKKVIIITTDKGKYVLKPKVNNDYIINYLISRNFNYYPQIIKNDKYEITKYIEQIEMPLEQKMDDLIFLVALLHNKTTHFKEISNDEYKKLYEDLDNNIKYLFSYYNDIMSVIESKIFMSPSEYLFARNISKIYGTLNFCKGELDKWEKIMEKKKKQRLVVLHNNLSLDHILRNEQSYLISWDKAKIDLPIFDLYKLYKRHGLEYDFQEIFKNYEKNYPLLEEERLLLFILISLPDKIEFNKCEFIMCQKITRLIDMIYKTERIISPYYSEKRKDN